MATTGVLNSSLIALYVEGSVILCSTDATITIENGTRETTCKEDDEWASYEPSIKSWNMSGSAFYRTDSTPGMHDMFTYLTGSTKGKVAVKWASKETGDKQFGGNGIITRLQGNSPGVNENATWDIDIQGTGALTSSTVS